MKQIYAGRLKYLLADYLTANIGFCIFDIGRFFTIPSYVRPDYLGEFLTLPPILLEQIVTPVVIVLLYALLGSYNRSNTLYKSRYEEIITSFIVSVLGMLGVFFAALIDDTIPERITNYELMLLLLGCLFVPAAIARLWLISANAKRIERGEYVMNTLVIGANSEAEAAISKILKAGPRSGLKLVGCANMDNTAQRECIAGLPVYTDDDLKKLCADLDIQALVVCPSSMGLSNTIEIINRLYLLEKPLFITPDIYGMLAFRPRLSTVVGVPLIDITNANISPAAVNIKRVSDIVISAIALIVLSPVMATLALAVRMDSKGPSIYRQARVGYHKKTFYINKFRTMYTDAEADGPALASDSDPRITKIGKVLRKYRLDELPQFWNVLVGEMSLVGPRPERQYYVDRIVERFPAYTLIHQVRPGITSWGMVKYGYASNIDEMIERLHFDLLYIDNVSFGVDLKILFHTVSTVVTGKGV